MSDTDQQAVRSGLSIAEIRRRYPGRPKVRGEHFGIWAWAGQGVFKGEIGGQPVDGIHRHKTASFPEGSFGELEQAGFRFVRWAAA